MNDIFAIIFTRLGEKSKRFSVDTRISNIF